MREFGQYRIESLMGSGGMGEVYRAYDTRRDREVALKLLPEVVNADAEYQRRFKRESYAVARLREPHVIPIHDYGEIDNRLFIDMRLVDGANLGVLIAETGPMPPTRAVALVSQIAEALDAAHANGLVHRDVKPSNVVVTPNDFVYVVDFGIAHAIGQTRSSTMTGATLGTIAYMAPERFENKPVDIRTDVYSLACVLYECLTAAKPFERDDLPSLMYAHLSLDPPAAGTLNPAVPAALDAVILRGMAKQPEDRFASTGELAAAARAALAENSAETVTETVAAVPVQRVPDERTEHLTHPTVAALVGAGAAVGRGGSAGGPSTRPPLPMNGPPTPDGPPPSPPSPLPPLPSTPDGGPGPRRMRRTVAIATAVILAAALVVAITITAVRIAVPSAEAPAVVAGPSIVAVDPAIVPAAPTQVIGNAVPNPTVNTTVAVGPTPGYMEIAPNGKYAYIANRAAGILTVFDTTRNVVTATIPIKEGGPQFVAFSPDGSRAYVSVFTSDRSVNVVDVIDTATRAIVASVPVGVRPFALDVSPDGKRVYVPNHDSGSITVIDTTTNAVVNTIAVKPNPHWVDISKDGARLYAANHESNVVSVIDLPSERVLGTVAVGNSPHSILVHPTYPLVFNVNYDSNTVSVIDTTTLAVIATVPTGNHPQDITLSADGKYAYLVEVDDNAVQILDTKTFEIRSAVGVGQSPTSIAVMPDGRHGYVTNLADGTVTILNLAGTA